MKIAIPLANHLVTDLTEDCYQLTLVDVDLSEQQILGSFRSEKLPPSMDELAVWLEAQDTALVIARGASADARNSLESHGIRCVLVANANTPHSLVRQYLARELDEEH